MKKALKIEEKREYYNIAFLVDKHQNIILYSTNIPYQFSDRNVRAYHRSLHAEKAVIAKYKRHTELIKKYGKLDLVSLRFKNGKIVPGGKPCPMCTVMLNKLENNLINRVYYY